MHASDRLIITFRESVLTVCTRVCSKASDGPWRDLVGAGLE